MNRFIFVYGFTLFNMFFGAGNLVFPLKIGQCTEKYWIIGFIGLVITGIILPFLGLFVLKLYKGDYRAFFGGAGDLVRLSLPLFALSLIGSFGGMPRCTTVAYGGMKYIFTNLPISVFSFIFCVAAFFVCLKEQRIVDVVGKLGGPILLVFFIVLVTLGALHQGVSIERQILPMKSFYTGFITGYQTMDLLAAFFFSSFIFHQIQQTIQPGTSDSEMVKIAIKSSIVGITLLMIVYMGMVYLGSHFSYLISKVDPALMLATISNCVLGNYAAAFVGIVIAMACFTTVVALNKIYAQYLCLLFRIGNDKSKFVLSATLVISFVVSLFDFNGIAKFLVPVLEVLYPSIIVLTIISIFSKHCYRLKMISFYGLLVLVLLSKLI